MPSEAPVISTTFPSIRMGTDLRCLQKRHNSSMSSQLLPLFPLQVVVFPRTRLPLHIFEERYKEMVGRRHPRQLRIRHRAGQGGRHRQRRLHGDGGEGAEDVSRRAHGHPDAREAPLRDRRAQRREGRICGARWTSSTTRTSARRRRRSGGGAATVPGAATHCRSTRNSEADLDDPQLSFQLAQAHAGSGFPQHLAAHALRSRPPEGIEPITWRNTFRGSGPSSGCRTSPPPTATAANPRDSSMALLERTGTAARADGCGARSSLCLGGIHGSVLAWVAFGRVPPEPRVRSTSRLSGPTRSTSSGTTCATSCRM